MGRTLNNKISNMDPNKICKAGPEWLMLGIQIRVIRSRIIKNIQEMIRIRGNGATATHQVIKEAIKLACGTKSNRNLRILRSMRKRPAAATTMPSHKTKNIIDNKITITESNINKKLKIMSKVLQVMLK